MFRKLELLPSRFGLTKGSCRKSGQPRAKDSIDCRKHPDPKTWSSNSALKAQIGDYAVDKDGTVTGPASKELVEVLKAKGFTSKNEEGENDHE